MSKLAEETVHAQLGSGPLQSGPDGLISHCLARALYRQAPGNDVVWDFTVNFSPNIIRPTTYVCASICVADVSNFNKPYVLADPRICQVVIRGSIGKSPMPLDLLLNMMICNRN